MATLQKIRDHAGTFVTILVALALLAFIVGDLFKADGTFGSSRNNVGEINGTSVPIQYYQALVDDNTEIYKQNTQQNSLESAVIDQIQDQTWNQLVRQYVIEDEYEKIGIKVTADEVFDMVQGNNIDPQVRQIPIFQDRTTGQFDRNLVLQFLKNKDEDPSGQAAASWASFERSLIEGKKDQKFISLVGMGMYSTALQTEKEAADKNTKYSFDYVQLRYNTVADSIVKVTEGDLKKYYNEHKDEYKQQESRDIYYVAFPIVASDEDLEATQKWAEDSKNEFATKSEDAIEQYVNLESEIAFNGKFIAKEDLTDATAELFTAANGTVVGPYEEDGYIKLARKLESAKVADSVQARHILIQPSASLTDEAAKQLADSILNAIKKGASFAALAEKYSVDGSAQKGGDLGWFTEGVMVKEFNDACFGGKKGDKVVAKTQFGYHVIEITDQTKAIDKVKIAVLARKVSASNKTVDQIYARASKFGSNNRNLNDFRLNADKEGLNLRTANVRRDDRRLANFENPRQIVRWVYKADRGDISEIFELDEQFVIAMVSAIHKEGVTPYDEVKAVINRNVLNEKKADYLIAKINEAKAGVSTLQSIADKLTTQVKDAQGVTYAAYSVPSLGVEPSVQAAMVSLDEQQISEPVKGNSGVYLIQLKSVEKAENFDLARERVILQRTTMSRAGYQVFNAIRDAADIEDNRSNFY